MTGRRAAPQSGAGPIAAVLPRAGRRVDAEWLERLAGRFDAVFVIGSSEGPNAAPAGAAAEWVADGDDVLDRIAAARPDRPVLLLRAGLELPGRFGDVVEAVAGELERTGAVAFPGNYDARFDPLAGLEWDEARIARLVEWSSDRVGQHVENPSPECLLLAPGRVSGHPRTLGIESAFVPDTGYVVDPDRETGPGGADQDGGESDAFDPVLGHLRRRVASLLAEGVESLPDPDAGAVTLHVTHSWGGGVWRWIEDLIAGDPGAIHLVLVAVSDGPGQLCGRYLKLCAAGPGRGVIRELALAPRIGAVATGHAGYREHLHAIVERFDVARIIVSSPVGHSLDCLRTGLPTIAVLHDFFPLWPLLEHDPMPFLESAGGDPSAARTEALSQYRASMRLHPPEPGFWNRIATAWLAAVDRHGVALAAPTRHVTERWQALAGDRELGIECIPHGFRPFSGTAREGRKQPRRAPRPAPEGRKLHLVIPGRLTEGKGLRLLEQALPELSGLTRVTALGCGRSGLALMGCSGVDLIPEYRRDELPALIDALAPDAALFLSTVPETWNYSLSEMRALGLVPVATRLGSFPERIDHGIDGWLFEPTVEALLECVGAISRERDRLAAMAECTNAGRTVGDMAADYAGLVPSQPKATAVSELRPLSAAGATAARQAGLLADATVAAGRARAERTRLREELERRARWAETMERQFRARTEWARKLDAEVGKQAASIVELTERHAREQQRAQENRGRFENTRIELEQTRDELERTQADWARTRDELEYLAQRHEALQAQFDQVVSSRSWKLTRPLRFVNRVLSRKRLRQAANPLQWPRMIGVFVRELRLRGLRQTLLLLQAPPVEGVRPRTALPGVGSAPEPSPGGAGAQPAPVALPETGEPVASIVVPVFNQLHFTAGCLASLASVDTRTGFEVIVVDDASGDGTPDWLKQCDGVRVVRNEENLGFIGSCNRGAAAARGRFLVFLNNDTRVTDGWLDALIETFARNPDAGAVGARLVFGDGTLQEAGGIVFRDASGWNYGRGDDPDRPEYRFVSEADYVSGACLAIPRELFESLGGFDDHFAPAYYEDTDLCFRVREHGRKVLYQPDSTVVHFEGGTSGTEEASGEKRYQAVNREKFRERWADELAGFPENPGEVRPDGARALRYRRFARRALVIDAVTPMPDHDSGSVRMFALLRLLGELGCRVSFMPQNLSWTGRHSGDLQQAGVEVLTAPWLSDPEDWLAEHGETLDLVIVSRHYVLAPLYRMLRALCPNAKIVFDTVDLHFLREEREADLAGTHAARRQAEKTRRQELGLIARADATLVVSDYERELLARLAPDADVHVVSNIHVLHDPGKPFDERRDLVFVGGFQHPPNVDAAGWMIDEILPRVVRRLPEVTLHLIGSRMPESIAHRRAPGLQVHGFVGDLEPYMSGCRISVAPLRYGAGVKGKVNQAMAYGLPVVATACAAEGMFAVDGRDILLADDAETFAERVVELYLDRDLWNRLAEGGRRNVEKHFSVEAARRALRALLADLHGRDSRIRST